MTIRRGLLWVGLAAVLGVGVFLTMAWRATTVTETGPDGATDRVEAVCRSFAGSESLLVLAPPGRYVRRDPPPPPRSGKISHLYVLAYRVALGRLIEVDVPFWFFKLKAPAAQFLVDGTGFDLNDLGVTAADLERQGPGIILDLEGPDGERLFIWTDGP